MYLRPFLLIQGLAFLTIQIWSYFRLRAFGFEFMSKLETLATSGYIPIPLPSEVSDYLQMSSLLKAGIFFTFTLGFTFGVVAFAGSLCLSRFRLPNPIRLGWTVLVSALFSLLLGFSPIEFLLFVAFFGVAIVAVKMPDPSFHKVALFVLVPLVMVFLLFRQEGFLGVRDDLLQNSLGRKVVSFYYRYSPISAELITPPRERTQVSIWTETPLKQSEKSWLLKKGIYVVSTRDAADFDLSSELSGPEILKAVEKRTGWENTQRLRITILYSILIASPLAVLLFALFAVDRLLAISKYSRIILIVCVASLSALLIYNLFSKNASKSGEGFPTENAEEIRKWVISENKTRNLKLRETFIAHLGSTNPAVRLWAATALAHLPSKENVEILATVARQDPVTIVRCKAIFALSFQGDRKVVPFLESRLKGKEDWYVKHYLLRALRRFGWSG